MFYYLKGELALCEAGQAVIDCGGVGYKLTTSLTTSQNIANKVGQNVNSDLILCIYGYFNVCQKQVADKKNSKAHLFCRNLPKQTFPNILTEIQINP